MVRCSALGVSVLLLGLTACNGGGDTAAGGSSSSSAATGAGGDAASSTGTNGHAATTGSAGHTGSTSSGANGGGGSASTGGGGSASTSSTTSTGGGGGGGGGAHPMKNLASVPDMWGLTLVGSDLYWVDGQNSSTGRIESVPITGGTVKLVYASSQLQGDLASDGTRLYFTSSLDNPPPNCPAALDGPCVGEIDSIKLDGTDPKTLAQIESVLPHASRATNLFVSGNKVYLGGVINATENTTVMAIPLAGGTPKALVALPQPSPGVFDSMHEVMAVDDSGIYFIWLHNIPGGTPSFTLNIGYTPLAGGSPSSMFVIDQTSNNANWSGDFTLVGGSAYFTVDTGGPVPSTALATLMKSSPPTGPASTIASFVGNESSGLIGDANGMYQLEDGAGHDGVYSVDLAAGTHALLGTSAQQSPETDLSALDASNVYFATNGGGSYTLYSIGR